MKTRRARRTHERRPRHPRKLGSLQVQALEGLIQFQRWSNDPRTCGWLIEYWSRTEIIMDSLVARGCAKLNKPFNTPRPYYTITKEGRRQLEEHNNVTSS